MAQLVLKMTMPMTEKVSLCGLLIRNTNSHIVCSGLQLSGKKKIVNNNNAKERKKIEFRLNHIKRDANVERTKDKMDDVFL